jgi:hypothetical protein
VRDQVEVHGPDDGETDGVFVSFIVSTGHFRRTRGKPARPEAGIASDA